MPTQRQYPDRTTLGLCAEAARLAIEDAGLRKDDVNGLVTDGGTTPAAMAEYISLRPTFATGVAMQGASGASATAVAASAVHAGYCDTVLVVMGNSRLDRAGAPLNAVRSEWEVPYGMAAGANTCSELFFYPRELCPACLSADLEWVPVSGKGRVYSYTIVHQPAHPAFREDAPHVFAIIQPDEGVRMTSNIVECPIEDVEVDMRVCATFDDVTPEVTLIKFRPEI